MTRINYVPKTKLIKNPHPTRVPRGWSDLSPLERRDVLVDACISTLNCLSNSSDADAARNRAEDIEIFTPAVERMLKLQSIRRRRHEVGSVGPGRSNAPLAPASPQGRVEKIKREDTQ